MFVVIVKGAVLNNGKLLIVQRAQNEKIAAGTWECPGGKAELREELETALKREIKEETGLNADVVKILYAAALNTDQTKQFVILTYLCKSVDHTVTLSQEHMDYRWVTRDEAKLLLAPNIIRDFERYNVFSLEEWL
jgi:8-oxo-dGTP diphosphatase